MSIPSALAHNASNWLQLTNKTAIITGASSGIGRATAQALHALGCHLVLADIQSPTPHEDTTISLQPGVIDTTATTGTGTESTVRQVQCDVTKREEVDALMSTALNWSEESTENAAPPASILINCAGIIRDRRVEFMTEDEWDSVLTVNLKGTFLTCQSFLQQRTANVLCTTPASIVNISSVVAQQGNIGQVNYAASKGGILGLTKALAKEVARRNVRVNAVLPGFIQTSMSDQVPDHILTNIIQPRIAMQRIGRPQEVADVIVFLASDRSSYISGTTIECSGMISL